MKTKEMKLGLDIGVGTNRSYPFRPRITVDYVPVFLDVERPSKEIKDKGVWIVADANHPLPFCDNVFDVVVASHIIEHLRNPVQFLKECHRVLKKGGLLYLYCPNFCSVNARKDPTHIHVFNAIRLYFILKKVGFRPHFDYSAGSRLPRFLQKLLTILMNLISEEIRFICSKTDV